MPGEEVQGFYMAKPMPIAALEKLFAKAASAPPEEPPELRWANA